MSSLSKSQQELLQELDPQIENILNLWLLANDWSVHEIVFKSRSAGHNNRYHPGWIPDDQKPVRKAKFIDDVIHRCLQRFCRFGFPQSLSYKGNTFTLHEIQEANRGHSTNYRGIYRCGEDRLLITTEGGHLRVLGKPEATPIFYEEPTPSIGGIPQIFEKIF